MHTMKTTRSLSAAAALLLLAACQGQNAQSHSTDANANPAEVQFTTNAYQIIEFDRQEGALARTEARDPEVKALAQQLTAQAEEFAARIAPAAADANITPPRVLRNDLRVRLGHMRLQQGLDFDRTYVADQIASHEEVLRMEDVMSNEGVSPQYSALMQQGNGLLRTNLEKLRALQAKMTSMRPPARR
jgi:predicted outer membrane protein